MKKEVIVISLGGSLIVPNRIDFKFLKEFRTLIKTESKKYKFIIITGGGKIARNYQQAATAVFKLHEEDLDWLGIHATRMNAHLLRTIMRDMTYPRVIKNPTTKVRFDNVLIGTGWKPGFSTDYDAVMLAKTYGAKTVINMTNVDYLHNKDPRKYKDARIIKNINWKGFRKIVGNTWSPGLNSPFDPIASRLASKHKMKLILIGKNLSNFKNLLDGKEFRGSVVEG